MPVCHRLLGTCHESWNLQIYRDFRWRCDVVRERARAKIEVLDMHRPEVAAKARQYGIRNVPAVVIDGTLAGCCADRGVDEVTVRAAGLGVPLT